MGPTGPRPSILVFSHISYLHHGSGCACTCRGELRRGTMQERVSLRLWYPPVLGHDFLFMSSVASVSYLCAGRRDADADLVWVEGR